MIGRSYRVSVLFGVGLVAVFVGERLLASGAGRAIASGAGVALLLGAGILRGVRLARADGERRRIEWILLGLLLTAVAGLLLYAVQSDFWTKVAGAALSKTSPKLATVLAALHPMALLFSILPTFLVELSYSAMQRAPRAEVGRVRDALLSGIGLASAIVFAFSAYYVASERDAKWDFSYFRTSRPGEATRKIVRGLDQKLDVHVFFPPSNEVREQVMEYLTDLARESPHLAISTWDQALDPKKAKDLGVTGNGTIVLARSARRELMGVGLEMEKARGQLRAFDQDFQKRLLMLARARRTIYFTTGHGERASDKTGPVDQRWTIRALREAYREQNHEVRNLGIAEGLGSEVPADAAAVVIAGPSQAFLPEEMAALKAYLDKGGRIFLALDPEAGLDFKELLAPYGVRFNATTLASDQAFLARTHQVSDRINIGTASYSSHPSVTTLGRLGGRAPFFLFAAGSLEAISERPQGVRVDFTVRAHPSTWNDANGNFTHDAPSEVRKSYELAAAISRTRPDAGKDAPEARLLLLADSDALGDPVIENAGNAYVALDGLKWLLGEEAIAGEISSEEDVPIQHTRKQDVFWFYSTVFLAPALVLAVGFFANRRSGRGKRRRTREHARQAAEAVR
jgi:hypothetical protein